MLCGVTLSALDVLRTL